MAGMAEVCYSIDVCGKWDGEGLVGSVANKFAEVEGSKRVQLVVGSNLVVVIVLFEITSLEVILVGVDQKICKVWLYLLVTRIKRLLLHRDPSSIILCRAFLLILNRAFEELFTLLISSDFGSCSAI